jgi:hypothetical protein
MPAKPAASRNEPASIEKHPSHHHLTFRCEQCRIAECACFSGFSACAASPEIFCDEEMNSSLDAASVSDHITAAAGTSAPATAGAEIGGEVLTRLRAKSYKHRSRLANLP